MKKSVVTPALTPTHAAFLADTIARNRALYGGWSMDGAGAGAGGGTNGDGSGSGSGGSGDGAGAGSGAGGGAGDGAGGAGNSQNAVDGQGNDLGYPANTPVAEMTHAQQAAYYRYHSRKHETRYKSIVGDRSAEEVQKDLEELAKIRREQQTPSEQAISDAREEGKKEAIKAERQNTATVLFRGALEANGVTGDDLDELVTNFNVAAYITDDGVDTTKITNFAKRFSKPGTGETRRRDFGGGNRGDGSGGAERGAAGKAEAARRFKKDKNA